VKYADLLPSIEDIERDPAKAKLPERSDGQMVAAFFVAHHVTKTNGDKLIAYVSRLKSDMQVLAIETITKSPERSKFMATSQAYNSWCVKNKDLLIAAHS
jgi:hypothetical protein